MNYNTIRNKPTINYRELIGDSTVSEVGGITEEEFNTLMNTDLASYYTKAQIDELFARSYVFRDKSGGIVTFDCPESTNGIAQLLSDIVAVQSGSGDPSSTNIRPFTGWSAVNAYDCGVNLYDIRTNRYMQGVEKLKVGDTLYIRTDYEIRYKLYVRYSGDAIATEIEIPVNETVTIPLDRTVVAIALSEPDATNIISNNKEFTISLTPIDDVVPYNSTTYTTALKDGQGNPLTCYGGGLMNAGGSQALLVTKGHIASYNGETLPSTWESDRDVYAEGTTPSIGAEVVYELETPIQIPQDSLSIISQSGTNNIWCDSGDITVRALDKIIQE